MKTLDNLEPGDKLITLLVIPGYAHRKGSNLPAGTILTVDHAYRSGVANCTRHARFIELPDQGVYGINEEYFRVYHPFLEAVRAAVEEDEQNL